MAFRGWTTKLASTFCVLLVTWSLMMVASGGEVDRLTVSAWRQVTWAAGNYQAWARSRSKVECVRECAKFSHCDSFAFNATSRTCYLQPGRHNGADAGDAADMGKVYVNKDPMCSVSDAPTSDHTVDWTHTLTSLRGEVTCQDNFVNTTSNVIAQCTAEGDWQMDGQCLQFLWPEPPMPFPVVIPRPVSQGWSVCLSVLPASEDTFVMSLNSGQLDKALVISVHFNQVGYNSTIVTNGVRNGVVTSQTEHNQTFPFWVSSAFDIKITVTSSEYKMYVRNNLILSYDQLQDLPASDISSFDVRNIAVHVLNLLCTD